MDYHLFFTVAQAEGGNPLPTLIFFILLFAGMWFLIIAPQRKRQKQHESMVRALQTGDQVITAGGVYGTITNVKDDRVVVRVAENVKVEVNRSFIQTKLASKGD